MKKYMFVSKIVLSLMVAIIMPQNLFGMKRTFFNNKKKIIFGLAYLTNKYLSKDDEIFDVSTVSKGPITVDELLEDYTFDSKDFVSTTKRQLEEDPWSYTGKIWKKPMFQIDGNFFTDEFSSYDYKQIEELEELEEKKTENSYRDQIDNTLIINSLVLSKKQRNLLTDFVMLLSHEENKFIKQGYVPLDHGTTFGLDLILRTIFQEKIGNNKRSNFVSMRNNSELNGITTIKDVHEFYKSAIKNYRDYYIEYVNRPREMEYRATSSSLLHPGIMGFDDFTDTRKYLLSTNIGFFGGNGGIPLPGNKETTCDFIFRNVIKKPKFLTKLILKDDRGQKRLEGGNFRKNIFDEYGASKIYEKYNEELDSFEIACSAGMVQMFIPEKLANKYCYLSRAYGEKVGGRNEKDVSSIVDKEEAKNLPDYQVRVLLHPELFGYDTEQKVFMRFYIYGNRKKVQKIINRLYEIAQAIKEYKEENL